MASISGTFAAFHEEMLAEHETWTMAGMGTRDHILENIWKSYQQAMESASYTSGDLSFRDYNSLDLSSDIYYYPSQLSESLTEFITAGNKGQVREIFQFLYYENHGKAFAFLSENAGPSPVCPQHPVPCTLYDPRWCGTGPDR